VEAQLSSYKGREHSYIKHCFLTEYLRAAAYKTFQGRSEVFNFVDAFAGPWRVANEDYSDASFDQALRTLESVRADLQSRGRKRLKVRFCFCEKDPESMNKLRKYARMRHEFEISIFPGKFEDNLGQIAEVCRGGFTFTFIDPTGWNIRSDSILRFLKDREGEFLLNFMAEPVNRHAGYQLVASSFGRFLADPNWNAQFENLPQEWGNERRVLHLLRRQIKNLGAAKYLPDFPILNPNEERVKMRLLLGTFSDKGLEVFRDVQQKVERLQIETREQLKSPRSLFTPEESAALQQGRAGIGCDKYFLEADALVVSKLQKETHTQYARLANCVIEQLPMRKPDVNKLLVRMKDRGAVKFDLPKGRRVPQSTTRISLPS